VQTRVQVTAPPQTTTPGEQPQPGGTLTAMELFDANSLDPAFGNTDPVAFFAVFDNLVVLAPSGLVLPELADAVTSSDAVTWTIKIKPNVRFSDGTVLDANAVKVNWDRFADPSNASPLASTVKTFTYQVLDTQTIKVTLSKANGQFPRVLSTIGFIGSPAAFQSKGSNFGSAPVGAGPMVLKSWVRGSAYTFERYPAYWNAPRPFLDRFILKPILDDSQRANSLKTGEADLIYMTTPQMLDDLSKSYPVYGPPDLSTSTFTYNFTKAPFNDKNARRAIQLSVDVVQLTKAVFGNTAEPPRGVFPATSPWSDPNILYPAPDLTTAQQLVNTWMAANGGKDLEFTITFANNPSSVQAMQFIQNQVQRLQHVKMNLNAVSVNQLITALVTKNFDAITFNYNGSDPEDTFNGRIESTSSTDLSGYKNSQVDSLIADSRVTLDPNQRLNDIKQVQKLVIDDVAFWPWNRTAQFYVFRPEIKNVDQMNGTAYMIDRIWIKTH
jgi:peptide/nickel transport system substrate-binding protein